jgi:hypothetical protein
MTIPSSSTPRAARRPQRQHSSPRRVRRSRQKGPPEPRLSLPTAGGQPTMGGRVRTRLGGQGGNGSWAAPTEGPQPARDLAGAALGRRGVARSRRRNPPAARHPRSPICDLGIGLALTLCRGKIVPHVDGPSKRSLRAGGWRGLAARAGEHRLDCQDPHVTLTPRPCRPCRPCRPFPRPPLTPEMTSP